MRLVIVLPIILSLSLFSCKKGDNSFDTLDLSYDGIIRPMSDDFNQDVITAYRRNPSCINGEVPIGDHDPTALGTIAVFRERIYDKNDKEWTVDRTQTNVIVDSIINGERKLMRYSEWSTGEQVYREIVADRDTTTGPNTYDGLATRPCGDLVREFTWYISRDGFYGEKFQRGGITKHSIATGLVEIPLGQFHAYKEVKYSDGQYSSEKNYTWQEICHAKDVGLLYDYTDKYSRYREFYLISFTPGGG